MFYTTLLFCMVFGVKRDQRKDVTLTSWLAGRAWRAAWLMLHFPG